MALIETTITDYLQAQVTGLVLWAEHFPTTGITSFPAAVYSVTGCDYEYNLNRYTGIATKNFAFEILSTNVADCYQTAEDIRLKLQGFSGDMGGVTVMYAFLTNEESGYYQPDDASDQGLYSVTVEYAVRVKEQIPSF